ncbi:putative thioredoxin-like domain-containing protein MRL7/MRL7L [Helianthus annuus]|nr:putative thioredoxin-like domain-containing protein MRL7/MRL7L [Helianthus annuus]
MRSSLEETFSAIQEQNSGVLDGVIKDRVDEEVEYGEGDKEKKGMVVEEEDPNWPVDAEVGWGIRASEYFEKHPIKNVVGEDGVEIDWEGELDDCLVKEINCLEWESFAFHPSPLIVLVFERYNR